MELTDDDVREILRIVAETPLTELSIETAGFSLYVRRSGDEAAAQDAPSSTEHHEDAPRNGLVAINAPMLGTFYRAEGPGRPPFVEVGATVEPETTVCIIEVMKMMNSIPAGVSGTIVEVCHENAQLVEYGQPLFRVRPA